MFEKIVNVIKNNFLYAILFIVALVIFAYYARTLVPIMIALICLAVLYICGTKLWNAYIAQGKKSSDKKASK